MSKRDTSLLLEDIKESIQKILTYTEGLDFNSFTADDKTVDAVIRNFEVIGEAANKVPQEYKDGHSDIEWQRMVGFRNRIIHEYFGIDFEIVWDIIQNNIPELLQKL